MNLLVVKMRRKAHHDRRNNRLRVGELVADRATKVTYTSSHPVDNWDWLREVTPLSKLERPA